MLENKSNRSKDALTATLIGIRKALEAIAGALTGQSGEDGTLTSIADSLGVLVGEASPLNALATIAENLNPLQTTEYVEPEPPDNEETEPQTEPGTEPGTEPQSEP